MKIIAQCQAPHCLHLFDNNAYYRITDKNILYVLSSWGKDSWEEVKEEKALIKVLEFLLKGDGVVHTSKGIVRVNSIRGVQIYHAVPDPLLENLIIAVHKEDRSRYIEEAIRIEMEKQYPNTGYETWFPVSVTYFLPSDKTHYFPPVGEIKGYPYKVVEGGFDITVAQSKNWDIVELEIRASLPR